MNPEPTRVAPVKLLCGLHLPQAGRCRPQTIQTRPNREDVCSGAFDLHRKVRQHAWLGSGTQSEFRIIAIQPKHWAESLGPQMGSSYNGQRPD
jgi:hypothetical protein